MDKTEIIQELRGIIENFLATKNIDLVDLIYRHEGSDLVIRILVDLAYGGISLGECASLNSEINKIIEEKNILQQRYILEVSSPGLDRPLISRKDFMRCLNKEVKFFLKEQLNGKFELLAIIKEVEDDSVSVDINSNLIKIPMHLIARANQIF